MAIARVGGVIKPPFRMLFYGLAQSASELYYRYACTLHNEIRLKIVYSSEAIHFIRNAYIKKRYFPAIPLNEMDKM